jgi:hypothetical protein
MLSSSTRFRFAGHRQSQLNPAAARQSNALRKLNAKDAAAASVIHASQFQLSFGTPGFGCDARSRWSPLTSWCVISTLHIE